MYKIVYYGDKRLKAPNARVAEVDGEIKKIVKNMVKTMFHYNGIGLAAPQVGINKKIVVIDFSFGKNKDEVMALINPEIIYYGPEKDVMEEGCLSFPNLFIDVERSKKVKVRATTLDGNAIEFEGIDFFARVLQHEIDHINSILMVDRISPLKKMEISGKLESIKKMAVEKE